MALACQWVEASLEEAKAGDGEARWEMTLA